ncbi:MAG: type-F conjugative transfer system pilin assembly protein TrbC [Alphaproteobacteria bacterium 41-28]|nr:MAG: type-F conjugative transfer system pilin assembly protein TrbC [Alphaproteobacteria bacterium 41-28]
MLPPIIFTHLMLVGFILSTFAEAKNQDLDSNHSWIRELTHQADTLSKTHQKEARSIVEGATRAVHQNKSCKVAQTLAQRGNEIVLKTLQPSEDEARYPRLLVFVSFSMPLQALKALGAQVNAVGGKLVLRGLVGGNFKKTAEKLKELQEEIIIDPTLFEDYVISAVPTFVLRNESPKKAEDNSYDRLTGNVSLRYALEQFASKGNTSQEAGLLLENLRRLP